MFFCPDIAGIAGQTLSQHLLEDDRRPSEHLLRWNFRQAVLANMKAAGEPTFEVDFPPGMDMMADMCRGPKAAERLEFEFFSRLAPSV